MNGGASYSFFKTYAGALGADVDLNAASTGGAPVSYGGGACAAIRCNVAGVLNVVPERGGAAVALQFAAGETQYVRASKLVASGSTATTITVYWE